jgi:hypothetical protein
VWKNNRSSKKRNEKFGANETIAAMRNFLGYLGALVRHWGVFVTGGAFIGLLAIWQETGHPVAHWIYWTIAVVGIAVAPYKAWLEERQRNVKATSTNQTLAAAAARSDAESNPIQIASPEMKQKIELHTHFDSTLGRREEKAIEPPASNVKFLRHRIIQVTQFDEGDAVVWLQQDGGMKAVVLDYRNEPKEGVAVPSFRDAVAHIRFLDQYGQELTSVSSAMWLNETSNKMTLEAEHTHSVLVAVRTSPPHWTSFSVKLSPALASGIHVGERQDIARIQLPDGITKVQVTLVDRNKVSTKPALLSTNFEYGFFQQG